MSATTTTSTDVRLPKQLAREDDQAVPFTRLIAVELRKQLDTRGGRWLLIGIGLITAVVVGIVAFTGSATHDKDFGSFLAATIIPQSFLLPILGIMAVTTEWSQRTGLVTFTLEPRRTRVATSKLVSVCLLGLAVVVGGVLFAAVSTFVTDLVRGSNPDWSVSWQTVLGLVLAQLINVGMGFAFGALIQNTPGAIVTYLFLPIVWSMLASISWMRTVGEWADTGQTLQPLFEATMHGRDWAQLATSVLIWLVLPLALGLWRIVRSEVKSA